METTSLNERVRTRRWPFVVGMIFLLVGFGAIGIWMKWEAIRQLAITQKNTHAARSLLLAMKSFASDYDGNYPGFDEEGVSSEFPKVSSELLMKVFVDEGYIDSPEALKWENPKTGARLPWIYVVGRQETSFSRAPVLAAPESERAGGRRIVGFSGGHVVMLREPEVLELLKDIPLLPEREPNPVNRHP